MLNICLNCVAASSWWYRRDPFSQKLIKVMSCQLRHKISHNDMFEKTCYYFITSNIIKYDQHETEHNGQCTKHRKCIVFEQYFSLRTHEKEWVCALVQGYLFICNYMPNLLNKYKNLYHNDQIVVPFLHLLKLGIDRVFCFIFGSYSVRMLIYC